MSRMRWPCKTMKSKTIKACNVNNGVLHACLQEAASRDPEVPPTWINDIWQHAELSLHEKVMTDDKARQNTAAAAES